MTGQPRIAVIGTGGWGKNHVRVLSELGSLVAVCDIDGARAKAYTEKYRVKGYTDVDEMMRNERRGRGHHRHASVDTLRRGFEDPWGGDQLLRREAHDHHPKGGRGADQDGRGVREDAHRRLHREIQPGDLGAEEDNEGRGGSGGRYSSSTTGRTGGETT